ncbi:MAG: hypothetical protein ACYCZM_14580 [Acidimicrobiales bacterium]
MASAPDAAHPGVGTIASETIVRFSPTTVSEGAARFARDVVGEARPESPARAKAWLFATSKLSNFSISVSLEPSPEVLLGESVIERFILVGAKNLSPATRRTLRTNLRAVAKRVVPQVAPGPVPLSRERAKAPYSEGEICAYLAWAAAQPTRSRRMRANGLICLGAGAGLMGADLRSVRGHDVISRSGGLVVVVPGHRSPVTRRPGAFALPPATHGIGRLRCRGLRGRRGEPSPPQRDYPARLLPRRWNGSRLPRHRATALDLAVRMRRPDRPGFLHGGGGDHLLPAARRHRRSAGCGE